MASTWGQSPPGAPNACFLGGLDSLDWVPVKHLQTGNCAGGARLPRCFHMMVMDLNSRHKRRETAPKSGQDIESVELSLRSGSEEAKRVKVPAMIILGCPQRSFVSRCLQPTEMSTFNGKIQERYSSGGPYLDSWTGFMERLHGNLLKLFAVFSVCIHLIFSPVLLASAWLLLQGDCICAKAAASRCLRS